MSDIERPALTLLTNHVSEAGLSNRSRKVGKEPDTTSGKASGHDYHDAGHLVIAAYDSKRERYREMQAQIQLVNDTKFKHPDALSVDNMVATWHALEEVRGLTKQLTSIGTWLAMHLEEYLTEKQLRGDDVPDMKDIIGDWSNWVTGQ